jgi:hypothetical protein
MKNIQCLLRHLGCGLGLGAMQILILRSLAVAALSESSESIAGCYYDFVTPISVGDGKSHPAFSTLELTPIGKNQYKFSIEVVGANFHMCGAAGIAIVIKRGKNPVLEMLPDDEPISRLRPVSPPLLSGNGFSTGIRLVSDQQNLAQIMAYMQTGDGEEVAERSAEPCKLRIRFTRDKVKIDYSGACREDFGCSNRVAYGDANFLRKNRWSKCPDEP